MTSRLSQIVARLLCNLIRLYRLILSPWIGWHCRFQPTCSSYGLQALQQHGAWRGALLTVQRLGKCHSFNTPGADGEFRYDPVPPATQQR